MKKSIEIDKKEKKVKMEKKETKDKSEKKSEKKSKKESVKKSEKKETKSNKSDKIIKPIKKSKGGNALGDLTGSIGFTIRSGFDMAKYMIIEVGNILNTGAQFKNAINPNMSGATPGNGIYNVK